LGGEGAGAGDCIMDFGSLNITQLVIRDLETQRLGVQRLVVEHLELHLGPLLLLCMMLALLSLVAASVSTVCHHRWRRRREAMKYRRFDEVPGGAT
jgi:hypothetical protein